MENNCRLGREREGHRLLWLFGQLWDEESSLLCSPLQLHSGPFSIIETDACGMGGECNTSTICVGGTFLHNLLVLLESLFIIVMRGIFFMHAESSEQG